MKDEHQISDFRFEPNDVQIYDPDILLEFMLEGTFSVEDVIDAALSMAKEGLGEGQAGVKLWRKRTRLCNGKLILPATDTYLRPVGKIPIYI